MSVDLVQRHGCGVVVPFGDVDATANAILALRADADRRQALGAAGRRAAVAELDWRHDGRRFTTCLTEWAENGPNRPAATR